MVDFAKYLPLSTRREGHSAGEEAAASTDWRGHLADTLNATADLLDTLTPEQWETQSMCDRWRVRDVAGHLVWRVGSSNRDLLASAAKEYFTHLFDPQGGLDPNRAIDVLSRKSAEAEPGELVRRIREIAAAKAAGRGRHGISELTEAVVHGYDLSNPLGLTLPVSAAASGAVALRQALLAPASIKAVLRARTLVATDAGWRLGRGPELAGTAEGLVLFLFGRRRPLSTS
jgi:uncharacterized protein (TIGR03083 family)